MSAIAGPGLVRVSICNWACECGQCERRRRLTCRRRNRRGGGTERNAAMAALHVMCLGELRIAANTDCGENSSLKSAVAYRAGRERTVLRCIAAYTTVFYVRQTSSRIHPQHCTESTVLCCNKHSLNLEQKIIKLQYTRTVCLRPTMHERPSLSAGACICGASHQLPLQRGPPVSPRPRCLTTTPCRLGSTIQTSMLCTAAMYSTVQPEPFTKGKSSTPTATSSPPSLVAPPVRFLLPPFLSLSFRTHCS